MNPERWQEIKNVLAGALEKAPEDRRAYLDQSCPDPDLRHEVESLIAAHEQGGSNFMERPDNDGALHPGTKLGPYEIVSPIGAGAMGEVYRARDPKLRRDVAIKVLPPAFVNAPRRLARFQREARLLASLNHPNIAAIHGFEDSGGAHALVMELVAGPTLAERIAQGPIPIDEALPIAKQIAEGLEYAHEHSIVHRDLKPANIKTTPDGTVKILDFGLAKAMERDLSPNEMGNSETLSQIATHEGVLLGTATYMSPEQAKAKPVDRRADVWALGCVLFEMLTGRTAFPGETITETLAGVLNNQPDWSRLPAATPSPVRSLLRRCLQKDPKQRLRDIGEARIAIEECLANPHDDSLPLSAAVASALPLWRRALPWSAAGTFALVALAVALFSFRRVPPTPAPSVASLEFDMGTLNLAATGGGSRIVISPNGRKMVFLATGSGSQTTQLYLRSMDSEGITPLPGTQGAAQPFFSPDGQWVGFSVNEKLEKVSLAGGLPVTLCDTPGNGGTAATWADNGSIYFIVRGKVERVPEGGGSPQPVAGADPGNLPYRWISSLPGSSGLLLVAPGGGNAKFDIDVLSLKTGKSKRLIDGGSWPRYLPTGQIVYAQFSSMGGTSGFTSGLLAVPFDLKRLAITGSPVPVTEGVFVGNGGAGFYDVAADGTLVYFPGGSAASKRLAWLNARDKIEPLPAPLGNYSNLSISPGGKRVAMTITTGSSQDVYIYNLVSNTTQRLTFEGANDDAIFTPDGSRVIYDSTGPNGGAPNLWMRAADGSGDAERLTTSQFRQFPASVSPNGKLLAYAQQNPQTGWDIYVMPLEGDRKPQVFLHSQYDEALPMFSPDGKWIAYMSDESGNYDIFAQAFPGPGGTHQISTGGGANPVWSRDGKKLYYNYGNNLMEVDVTTRPTFSAGTPRLVSANLGIYQAARNFDVAPDGRILLAQHPQQSEQGSSQLHVVLNFETEVQNRLAAAKQ